MGQMQKKNKTRKLSFLESVFFSLVEQVRLWGPQVDDFGAAIPVLLLNGALLAVVGVGDARPSTDHTAALEKIEVRV